MRLARAAAVLCLAFPNAPVSGAEPPKPRPGDRDPRRDAHRRRVRRAPEGPDRRRARKPHRERRRRGLGEGPGRRARRRPLGRDGAARPHRQPHAHLPAGRGPGRGRLRRPAPEASGVAYRAARATVSARRALEQGFTTIRDVETEGAGYGDVGIKQAIEAGYIPGPRMFVVTRAISTTGGYPPRGLRAGDRRAEGSADRGRARRGAQGGARAARQRRRLDQGLHDAPLLARPPGQPRLAADAHARGDPGDRGRGARLGAQGRVPRLQRDRAAAARSTAAATRSSTGSSWTTPTSPRWSSRARGTARR